MELMLSDEALNFTSMKLFLQHQLTFSTFYNPISLIGLKEFHYIRPKNFKTKIQRMEVVRNIVWHNATITKADRHRMNGHKSAILWFTGLSGAGKSTLANKVEEKLFERGIHTYVLDGDNIRHGLNKGLGFSAEDRKENIRRIGEVAKLFVDAGAFVGTAFISPYRSDRDMVREIVQPGEFIEVYVYASLEVCEQRDPKGLYKKARAGEIKNFTGIDDPYEAPEKPELVINTGENDLETCAAQVMKYLEDNGYIDEVD